MKVGITPSEQEILKHISQYGPKTGYELGKSIKYSEKTSYQGVKNLVDKELLSVSVIGETRAGLDMKAYSLTVLGLATALLYPQVHENPRNVIKSWDSLLPLVLGKWDFFISAGVEDLVQHHLMIAAVTLVRASESLEWEFEYATPIDPAEIFRSNFYNPPEYGWLASETRLKWIEVCARDPEIRRYLAGKLAGIITKHELLKHEAEVMLKALGDEEGFLSTPF